jgi:hypothetical protein
MATFTEIKNINEISRANFERALRRARKRKIINLFQHKCNDLVPANTILNQLPVQDRKDLGVQDVPLQSIVGSSGRYHDFDLAFLPLNKATMGRWISIANAFLQSVKLPPVSLTKIGTVYFVEDGNHRVSVARLAGRRWIRARVIEINSPALISNLSCTRLGFKLLDDSIKYNIDQN